jgi:hypothetical protein
VPPGAGKGQSLELEDYRLLYGTVNGSELRDITPMPAPSVFSGNLAS